MSIWKITRECKVKEGIEECKFNKASNASCRLKKCLQSQYFKLNFQIQTWHFGSGTQFAMTHIFTYFHLAHQDLCLHLWQSNYTPLILLRTVKSWPLSQPCICNARKKMFPLGSQLKLCCLWFKLRTSVVACITTSVLPIRLLSCDPWKWQSPQIGYALCKEKEISDDRRTWP